MENMLSGNDGYPPGLYILFKYINNILLLHYNSFTMKSQSDSTALLYNQQALKLFLPYLKLSDLLGTATISKEWHYNLVKYLKQEILPHPYNQTTSAPLSTTKLVFHRKVTLLEQNKPGHEIEFPEICTSIEMGAHVSKFGTLEGNIYLIRNSRLSELRKQDWKNGEFVIKVGAEFSDVRCVGCFVYMIAENCLVRYTTNPQGMLGEETKIDFEGTLEHCILSISAVLLILTTDKKPAEYHFFTHKEPNPKKCNLQLTVQSPSTNISLDFGTHGYILSSQGTLYEVDFAQEQAKVTEVKMLAGKTITKFIHGNKHYFAYERKKKPIRKWTNAEVLKWAEEEGFDGYLNILAVEKVDGERLLTMNKLYMENVLGITSTLTQQKMGLLIQQSNKDPQNFQDYIVHCWGKNDKGQLCQNPSSSLSHPQKLKLPQDFQLHSTIDNLTLIQNPKTNQLLYNTMDDENKLKWTRIADNKVWSISSNKNYILICQSVGIKKVLQADSCQPLHFKKDKLRTAKNVMDQVMWDPKYSKLEFRVGYADRYQGVLECAFEDFIKSDVKDNSVLYFKKNGKIVWDKKSRLDIL